jgi:four helix bundle protein
MKSINKLQNTNNKLQTTNIKQQTSNNKHQTSNIKQQTTNNKHQTSNIKQMATWTTFEEIEAWQLARKFCKRIDVICYYEKLSKDFGLKDQINRSSGSIMDNIAEGFGRGGTIEFKTFLSYSEGSANESKSQLYRIYDKNYISENEFTQLKADITEIINKIGALIRYLNGIEHRGIKYKS